MSLIVLIAASVGLAVTLGAMVMLTVVVAPTAFTALEAGPAGRFLRALFPRYYALIVGSSTVAALGLAASSVVASVVMAAVAVSTLWVRQWLVPQINAARDAVLAGDDTQQSRFDRGHRLSVMIHAVQLLAVLAVVVAQV